MLGALGLEHPPVALAIVDLTLADIKVRVKEVDSNKNMLAHYQVKKDAFA